MTTIEKYECDRCKAEIIKYSDKFSVRTYPGELQKLLGMRDDVVYIGDTYIDLCPACAQEFISYLKSKAEEGCYKVVAQKQEEYSYAISTCQKINRLFK